VSKVGVGSILGHFAFVGWVEPIPGFVGFRCTQPNLHFAGVIGNCITQQRPISEPSPKSFFFDQTGFFGPAALTLESLAIATAAKNSGGFVVVQVE
jgi:hypothetical protein